MIFTLNEVRDFTAHLNLQIEKCANGEGTDCMTLDAALSHHADLCCKYARAVRDWAHAIFTAKVPFDAEVEQLWLKQGRSLYLLAWEMSQYGEQAEVSCYDLPGQNRLIAALWDIEHLLKEWVSPKPSVAPAPRIGLPADAVHSAEIRRRINSLPQLPADWKPTDRLQRFVFRTMKRQ